MLRIEDLSVSEELDRKAMAETRGGSIYADGRYWGERTLNYAPDARWRPDVERVAGRHAHTGLTAALRVAAR